MADIQTLRLWIAEREYAAEHVGADDPFRQGMERELFIIRHMLGWELIQQAIREQKLKELASSLTGWRGYER